MSLTHQFPSHHWPWAMSGHGFNLYRWADHPLESYHVARGARNRSCNTQKYFLGLSFNLIHQSEQCDWLRIWLKIKICGLKCFRELQPGSPCLCVNLRTSTENAYGFSTQQSRPLGILKRIGGFLRSRVSNYRLYDLYRSNQQTL